MLPVSMSVEFDVPESNKDDLWDFQYRLEAQVTDSSRRSIKHICESDRHARKRDRTPDPDQYVYSQRRNREDRDLDNRLRGPASVRKTLFEVHRCAPGPRWRRNRTNTIPITRCGNELSAGDVTPNREGQAVYEFQVHDAG